MVHTDQKSYIKQRYSHPSGLKICGHFAGSKSFSAASLHNSPLATTFMHHLKRKKKMEALQLLYSLIFTYAFSPSLSLA